MTVDHQSTLRHTDIHHTNSIPFKNIYPFRPPSHITNLWPGCSQSSLQRRWVIKTRQQAKINNWISYSKPKLWSTKICSALPNFKGLFVGCSEVGTLKHSWIRQEIVLQKFCWSKVSMIWTWLKAFLRDFRPLALLWSCFSMSAFLVCLFCECAQGHTHACDPIHFLTIGVTIFHWSTDQNKLQCSNSLVNTYVNNAGFKMPKKWSCKCKSFMWKEMHLLDLKDTQCVLVSNT